MICLHCGYSLEGLLESRCPECGRPFDLSRPETFWQTTRPKYTKWIWRRWAKPPPWWHVGLVVIATLAVLEIGQSTLAFLMRDRGAEVEFHPLWSILLISLWIGLILSQL